MKLCLNNLIVLFVLFIGVVCYSQENRTIIKGTVHDWPTDTIYLQTMPFNSPYSSELKYQTISKDKTFSFEFESVDRPFVVQLFLNRKNAEVNKEQLLHLNLTDKYYFSHCIKFYTYGTTTFLLEPGKVVNVELEINRSISRLSSKKAIKYRELGVKVSENNTVETTQKTSIRFAEPNSFKDEYYQKTFNLDNKIGNRLDIYKTRTIGEAIISFKKIYQKLLNNLEAEKDKLSAIFYDYIKSEIEFGARKEFLKFLMFSKEKEMDAFFSKEIPKEIIDIIEFDKYKISASTIISEEYNKFLMLYLNFKMNIKNKKYSRNYEFNFQKIKTAIRNFPKESVYYYLANHLLQPHVNRKYLIETIKNKEAVEELITKTITKYPNGELNEKLIEKYDL